MRNVVRSWEPRCQTCAPGVRWHVLVTRRQRRRLSSSLSRERDIERLVVVCGSAGSIDVDLYNVSALTNPTSPLIIYLPPTGTHLRPTHPQIPSYLFHSSAALARINYRWNIPPSTSPTPPSTPPTPRLLSSHPSFANHPFPTPLHDILHGYTHLLRSLLPRFSPPPSSSNSAPHSPYSFPSQTSKFIQRPIIVYGSYLGGTLAATLALTESFTSKQLPYRILGLIAKNGIYDWTHIATTPPPPPPLRSSQDSSSWGEHICDTATLHGLKHRLFTGPAGAFDSFASPILFFRTSGLSVPKTWLSDTNEALNDSSPSPSTSSSQDRISNDGENDIFYPTPDPSLATDADSKAEKEARSGGRSGGEIDLEVTRRANLKYPPKDSGLKIPPSLFLYTSPPNLPNSPSSSTGARTGEGQNQDILSIEQGAKGEVSVRSQAEEIAGLMRRSVLLHEFKERVLWDEDLDPHSAATSRIQVSSLPPTSTLSPEEEARIVRSWIEDTLDT